MERLLFGLIIMAVFLGGFLSSYTLNSVYIDKENPYFFSIKQGMQPGNWIKENNIEVLPDRVVIHVKNADISSYADTGSMLPTLGENANGVRIKPESENQIKEGDIITYENGDELIVHRVVAKGIDEQGTYFITKGDNNTETDGKIYFKDVRYVTVALIY